MKWEDAGTYLSWDAGMHANIGETAVMMRIDPDSVDMVTINCCVSPGKYDKGRAKEAPKIEPMPSYEAPKKLVTVFLTHNELMRRFRFNHPIPLPELYTNIFA